jgi:hypothetical protein
MYAGHHVKPSAPLRREQLHHRLQPSLASRSGLISPFLVKRRKKTERSEEQRTKQTNPKPKAELSPKTHRETEEAKGFGEGVYENWGFMADGFGVKGVDGR